jgi:TatD DNase family protein
MSDVLVDFHCHLDLYPDHVEQVARCEREGIFALTVTTTPKAWKRNHQIASVTKHVRVALGLHPQLVAERAAELSEWEDLLPQARYVGEVGLDAGPRYYKSLDAQKGVFEKILRACAQAGGKILTIHSVRAVTPVLDMLERHLPSSKGLPVLHWFTGSSGEARRAVEMGCYFSVNARMLANEKHRAILSTLPLDRLLTETDGPFTNTGDRPSRPGDVRAAIEGLASLRKTDPDAMQRTIAQTLTTVTNFGR